MSVEPATYNAPGPVFISYRHSDGKSVANECAERLRAAGVPVWIDVNNANAGDIWDRIVLGLKKGISGAIIIATPDIRHSSVVKQLEAPALLALLDNNPSFSMVVVNTSKNSEGSVDYSQPDKLLDTTDSRLARVKQYSNSAEDLDRMTEALVLERVESINHKRASGGAKIFRLSIYTRESEPPGRETSNHLDIYLPHKDGQPTLTSHAVRALMCSSPIIRRAVSSSGAECLQVEGRAHLSVAFALGAQLPSTLVRKLKVTQADETWNSYEGASNQKLLVRARGNDSSASHSGQEVAVFVNFLDTSSPAAFDDYVRLNYISLSAWTELRLACKGRISPDQGGVIACEAAQHIRQLSRDHQNAHVHLFLGCPFPIAVLIGRLMNTLDLSVYEWQGRPTPCYIKAMTISTSYENVIRGVGNLP